MVAKTRKDIDGVRAAGSLVRLVFDAMRARAHPGATTIELDRIAERLLSRHGARSAPAHFYDFPGATCISLNEEAAHGVPGPRKLKQGDISISTYLPSIVDTWLIWVSRSWLVEVSEPSTVSATPYARPWRRRPAVCAPVYRSTPWGLPCSGLPIETATRSFET